MQTSLLYHRPLPAFLLSCFGPARGRNLFSFWGGLLFTLLVLGTARPAFSQTTSFTCTGAAQTYTVPAGITSLSVTVKGADGGMSQYTSAPLLSTVIGHSGGRGALINGRLSVTPGQVLNLYVGCTASAGGVGGFNGGGSVANVTDRASLTASINMFSNGGGGASDIRVGGAALSNRVVVAGGGGGSGAELISTASEATDDPNRRMGNGGYGGAFSTPYPGGFGGGFEDSHPGGVPASETIRINAGGHGGTDAAGGLAGVFQTSGPIPATVTVTISQTTAGVAGSLGQGAEATLSTAGTALAGGGGGGYYGGGSGASGTYVGRKQMIFGGGGGGGSSFVGPTFTSIGATGSDGINANGFITITPITSATATVSGNLAFCTGQSTTLTASGANGTAPYTYTWVAPAGITFAGGSTSATGTTVVATAGAGVSGIRTLTVTVADATTPTPLTGTTVASLTVGVPPANPSLVASGPITCTQTSVTLTASTSSAGSFTYAFAGTGLTGPNATAGTATAADTGPYSVTITDLSTGCTSSTTTTVQINTALTAVSIGASAPALGCEITSITLTANGPAGTTYLWDDNSTAPTRVVMSAGTYGLSATATSGCSATATPITIGTGGGTLPTVTLVFNSGTVVAGAPTVTIPATPGQQFQVFGGTSYEYQGAMVCVNGYQINQFDSNNTGIFTVREGAFRITVRNGNGCSRTVQGVIESR